MISEVFRFHACISADAVLVYLPSFAGALPVWWHRVGRFLPGGPPAPTPQYSHTHGQSRARGGIQSNRSYIKPHFCSGSHEFDLALRCTRWFLMESTARCLICCLQKLTNVRIMKENMRTGNLSANMRKNRVLQIIPCKETILRCCHSDSS